ncbi:RidA family protein [Bacillus tuaregi]|uniref:RidA family protein n=1 Tax=Bacillus tuaregi TaxID=1816695 RepID=UPI0008F8456D|nr:RidA family protein [Bacillus tuaregi]
MTNQIKTPEEALSELGITLEPARQPLGNYIGCVRTGNLIFTSGQISDQHIGTLGQDLTIEDGYQAARQAGLNVLRILKSELGELSRVKRVVKVFGMVHSALDFTDHPKVINGASDLFVEVFGEKGIHARSAVGFAQLPKSAAVELEIIVEVED